MQCRTFGDVFDVKRDWDAELAPDGFVDVVVKRRPVNPDPNEATLSG